MSDVGIAVGAQGLLREFNELGVLTWAEVHPAQQLCALYGETDDRVRLALALAVRAIRAGSVCVDLTQVTDTVFETDEEALAVPPGLWPEIDGWLEAIRKSPVVTIGADVLGQRPLRLADGLLYLERYWREEETVRVRLGDLGDSPPPKVDGAALAGALDALYPPEVADPDQRVAAAVSLLSRVTVIAGGPGTGKTTTIASVLSLLHRVGRTGDRADTTPRVALCAPTGKAAARMKESLERESASLTPEVAAWMAGLPAMTLHRLLGWRPESRTRFRHDADNPLPHDVVIVDEMSMVPLTMMARLLEAVRSDARLILVGDPDQLASVEAGAVLADIVRASPPAHPGVVAGLAAVGVADQTTPVVHLTHTWRFDKGIQALAEAVRAGDAEAALAALRSDSGDLEFHDDGLPPAVAGDIVGAARDMVLAARAGRDDEALAALSAHRVLCAHRRGPYGASTWARTIEGWLADSIGGLPEAEWYPGRPVMVTQNAYDLGLFNGDTGVVVEASGRPVVSFGSAAAVRTVSPYLLDSSQTVYAMTVHKAQGSQFGSVTLILPPADSPLLTRELLYTAVTRATSRVTVIGTEDAVRRAVERPALRASGLRGRL